MTAWRQVGDGLIVAVRATPRAKKESLVGDGERFAARIAAPPVDGAANEAVAKLLARAFDVPKRAITLIAGEKSREKRFRIQGDAQTLAARAASLYGAEP